MGAAARVLPTSPLDQQMEDVRSRYPGASIRSEGGVDVVSIPGVKLPGGWNKTEAAIHFIVPPGYPHANPDCFNTDSDLRLAGGGMPRSAGLQVMPIVGNTLWFSWHIQRPWKPGRDSLLSWLAAILARFEARS